jgi:ubiquinone biosynthesis protein
VPDRAARNDPAQDPRLCRRVPGDRPSGVKLGQTLATRPDIVGEEAARNLLTPAGRARTRRVRAIRKEIEATFEVPLEASSLEFDPEPVGSASIAQVHRAVTIEGRQVAVKVRRPGIDKQFARDIDTYEWAAAHLEALGGEATRLRPRQVIANFRAGRCASSICAAKPLRRPNWPTRWSAVPTFEVPAIDWDRTASRVMTLDWIDGIKISHRDALVAAGHDMEKLSANLVNAFLRQAIAEGFFHADMHQGNLFVKADGTIAAVDFGIMGRINRQARCGSPRFSTA